MNKILTTPTDTGGVEIFNECLKIWRHIIHEWLFPADQALENIRALSPWAFRGLAPAALPVINQSPRQKSILRIEALFRYKHPLVRHALWALKYQGDRQVTALFAALAAEVIATKVLPAIEALMDRASSGRQFYPILLIPLPCARERLSERGWNQTFLVAQAMAAILPAEKFLITTSTLEKIHHTAAQASLKRKERLVNLAGCFKVPDPSAVFGKTIILFDDVVTTGSTLSEAAFVLKQSGAGSIFGLALAH